MTIRTLFAGASLAAAAGCAAGTAATTADGGSVLPRAGASCDANDGGITLARGFCAQVAHEGVGSARHVAVAPNGDVFVALRNTRDAKGGIVVLRDADGDGRFTEAARFGDNGGTGIARQGDWLWFATNEAVLRYRIPAGAVQPTSTPDTIVAALPADRSHAAKTIVVTDDGTLFVNIGSPSNACQEKDREAGSKGLDPCPELATRAGIWRFDAHRVGQRQADGERWATGLRNMVAIALGPDGRLYGAQHGRDQLHGNWPSMFTEEQNAETPSEEFMRIDRGDDYGWPYCYHDRALGKKVLAPEYGGDGRTVGRCASAKMPLAAFPGHWAPNGLEFAGGAQFPARYRSGAFIAWHGSWNRAPLPQAGYRVSFVPMANGTAGEPETFADGFAGTATLERPNNAQFRPMDVALMPDGTLLIVDSVKGRIWRVMWKGDETG